MTPANNSHSNESAENAALRPASDADFSHLEMFNISEPSIRSNSNYDVESSTYYTAHQGGSSIRSGGDTIRNAQLEDDGRDDEGFDVKRLANITVLWGIGIATLLVIGWYCFSISISVYNKWMFGGKNLSFNFPIYVTSFHMFVQFCFAALMLRLFPSFSPKPVEPASKDDLEAGQASGLAHTAQEDDPYEHSARAAASGQVQSSSSSLLTMNFYLTRILPCALATALDIGLGNMSLRYVTLTFFTMVKSTTLGSVMLFAVLFKLEKWSWKVGGILLLMTIGVLLMVAGETDFSPIGFVLLMTASLCSGLRWALTQMLLLQCAATSNPFASLYYLTPAMGTILFVLGTAVEGPAALFQGLGELADHFGVIQAFGLLLLPGCLAFCMTVTEFALLKRSSVVTLSVFGIFKETITIGAGNFFFHDRLTPVNISGLITTIIAIIIYNYDRFFKNKKQAIRDVTQQLQNSEERAPMLPSHDTPAHSSIHSSQHSNGGESLPRRGRGRAPSTADYVRRGFSNSISGNGARESPVSKSNVS